MKWVVIRDVKHLDFSFLCPFPTYENFKKMKISLLLGFLII